jgi:hypothetical protein
MIIKNKNVILTAYIVPNFYDSRTIIIIINNVLDQVIFTTYLQGQHVTTEIDIRNYYVLSKFLGRYFEFYTQIHNNIAAPELGTSYILVVDFKFADDNVITLQNLSSEFLSIKDNSPKILIKKQYKNYVAAGEEIFDLPDIEKENIDCLIDQVLSGEIENYYPEYNALKPYM